MASELKVDKFTGVTTAGSILVTGEGNSTTTNLQQGLAKCWVNFAGNASGAAANDSFNLASMTDNGTGDYTLAISNDMASASYSATATGYKCTADFGFITNNNSNYFTASTLRIETVEHDGGHKQTEFVVSCVTINGDLA